MWDDDVVDLAVEVLRMLADPTRLQVAGLLLDEERSVSELATILDKPVPGVSQHLAKMRMARLVTTRKQGTSVLYRVENGHVRQLVIDTIGLSAKNSYIDNFRTPHTEKLHVVERLKLAADGKSLEASVWADDPDTFNEPLNMVQRWRKVDNPLLETVCAEDNEDYFNQNLFPLPEAKTSDF